MIKTMENYEKTCYDYLKSSIDNRHFVLDYYGGRISSKKLLRLIDDCAENMNEAGIGSSDVVTVCLPNSPQMIIAIYALSKLGAVVSLISPLQSAKQVAAIMKNTDSKILIKADIADFPIEGVTIYTVRTSFFMGPIPKIAFSLKKKYNVGIPFEALLKPHQKHRQSQVDCKCCFALMHSGGTTGEPKTVMLSQAALNYCALTITRNLQQNGFDGNNSVFFHALPVFYGYGLGVMHTELLNGEKIILAIKFNGENAVKRMAKQGVGYFFGVPMMFKRMFATGKFDKENIPSFRLGYVGGEALTKQSLSEFNDSFKGDAALIEGYGLTECVCAFVALNKNEYKEGSCGKCYGNVVVEAFDENNKPLPRCTPSELCVSTNALMLGYYHDEKTTEQVIFDYEGKRWLRTGDFGYVDDDGFIFIIQRIKNIIKRNSINIYPSQIEACLMRLDYIRECAVFGNKDADGVERIIAAVVLKEKTECALLEEEIRYYVTHEMSILSCPETILFLDSLPRTTVGKVDVNALKETL